MNVGTLEIQLLANLARLEKDMRDAKMAVGAAMSNIDKSVSTAKNALAGFGVALGAGAIVGAMVSLVKNAIDTGDALYKMSQKTGLTVEELSKLSYAAKLSDVSQEDLGKSIKKLSVNMVDAFDPLNKNAKLFKELGVNISGNTQDAMLKISDTFAKLPDGATKAALATELFGKAGDKMIPLLNQGSAGIAKMTAEAEKLGLVMSTQAAKDAEAFNDNLTALKAGASGLGIAIASNLLPGLVEITDNMKRAYIESGIFKAGWIALGGAMTMVFTDDMLTQAQKLTKEIANQASNVEHLESKLKALNAQMAVGAAGSKPYAEQLANNVSKALSDAKIKMDLAREAQDRLTQADEVAAAVKRVSEAATTKASAALEKSIRNTLALKDASAQLTKSYNDLMQGLKEKIGQDAQELALGRTLYEGEKILADVRAGKYDKYSAAQRASIELAAKEIDALVAKTRAVEDYKKAMAFASEENGRNTDFVKSQGEAQAKTTADIEDSIEAMKDAVELIELETKLLGATKLAREQAILALEKERALRDVLDPQLRSGIELLYQEKDALLITKDAALAYLENGKQQLEQYNQLSKVGGDFFTDLLFNGKQAFTNLKDYAKDFLKQMIATFAQKFILNIAANGTGGTGGGIAGAAASALSGAAGQLGVSGLFAAGSQFIAGMSLPAGAVGAGAIAQGVGVASTSAAGLGSTIATAIAAIPVWGWIAAGIAALAIATRDKGENWKAQLAYGADATAYAIQGVFGKEGFLRIAGDDKLNSALRTFMEGFGDVDKKIVGALKEGQQAQIEAQLAALKGREFAFGKNDGTAGEQIQLAYLQGKYAIVFAEIDATFAASVANWQGKAEDLAKSIVEFSGVLEVLSQNTIAGLTLPILRELTREGETLAQSLTRVGTAYGVYASLFIPASQGAEDAFKALQDAITAAGGVMPSTREEYKRLVDGTISSNTALWSTLIDGAQIADAFYTAHQAALAKSAGILDELNNAIASRDTGFARDLTLGNRNNVAQQIADMLNRQFDEAFLVQLATAPQQFIAGLDDAGRALLTRFLGLQTSLEGLDTTLAGVVTVTTTASTAITTLTEDTTNFYVELQRQSEEANAQRLREAQAAEEARLTAISSAQDAARSIYDRYATEAEKLAAANASLIAGFGALGLAVPSSAAQLLAYAQGADVSAAAGQALLAALSGLTGAFDAVQNAALSAAAAAAKEAADKLAAETAFVAEMRKIQEENMANEQAALNERMALVDAAQSQSKTLLDRYQSDEQKIFAAKDLLRSSFTDLGLAIPKTAADFYALVASADASTAAGQTLLAMLSGLSGAFDTVQSVISQSVTAAKAAADQEAKAAADASAAMQKQLDEMAALDAQIAASSAARSASIAQLLASFETPTERLAQAVDVLNNTFGSSAGSIDFYREQLALVSADSSVGIDALQGMAEAIKLVTTENDKAAQAAIDAEAASAAALQKQLADMAALDAQIAASAAARAASIEQILNGFETPTEKLAKAVEILNASFGNSAGSIDFYREQLALISADSSVGIDALQGMADAIKLVAAENDRAAKALVDAEAASAAALQKQLADMAALDAQIAASAASRAASILQILDGFKTPAENLSEAVTLLQNNFGSSTLSIDAYRQQLALVSADSSVGIDALQGMAAAIKLVTAENDKAAQAAIDAEAAKAAEAKKWLDQMIADAKAANDLILKAQVDGAAKAVQGIEAAFANLEKLGGLRENIGASIAGLLKGRAGYDFGAYLGGNVDAAKAKLANAQGVDAQIAGVGKVQGALQAQYQYQLDGMQQAQKAQADLVQSQVNGAKEAASAARQNAEAFKRMGDYAKGLLLGDLSTLNPQQKLAEAQAQFRSVLNSGGDASGAADTYLKNAQAYFGSTGDYATIFASVQGELASRGVAADAQLQYAASMDAAAAASQASLAELTSSLTPQMIALQDEYIANLREYDAQAAVWEDEQRASLANNSNTYIRIAESNAEVAANTANLSIIAQQQIAEFRALREMLEATQRENIRLNAVIAANTADTADGVIEYGDTTKLQAARQAANA